MITSEIARKSSTCVAEQNQLMTALGITITEVLCWAAALNALAYDLCFIREVMNHAIIKDMQ